jgi:hypothetical protein
MAWTWAVYSKAKERGKGYVTVRYSESVTKETLDEQYEVIVPGTNQEATERLKAIVQARLNTLNNTYTYIESLPYVNGSTFDLTPAPTQAQIDLTALIDDIAAMRGWRGAIALGKANLTDAGPTAVANRIAASVTATPALIKYVGQVL